MGVQTNDEPTNGAAPVETATKRVAKRTNKTADSPAKPRATKTAKKVEENAEAAQQTANNQTVGQSTAQPKKRAARTKKNADSAEVAQAQQTTDDQTVAQPKKRAARVVRAKKTQDVETRKCTLVVDHRENSVRVHEEMANIPHVVDQLTIGDYSILAPDGNELLVIERKSYEDFSASFKDGRHQNKQKMLALREQTGCRVFYLVEGPAYPSPQKRFGRIAFSNIQSSIFHMMVRDCINVIYTRDTLHTAQTLAALLNSMNTLLCKTAQEDFEQPEHTEHEYTCEDENCTCNNWRDPEAEQCEKSAEVENVDIDEDADAGGDAEVRANIQASLDRLKQRTPKSDLVITRTIWSKLKGITVETADDYIRLWSLSDLVCGRVSTQDILSARTSSGKPIPKSALAALTSITAHTHQKMLACVPGISSASAAAILRNAGGLPRLLGYTQECIGMITINAAGKKLGDKRASQILAAFNYRRQ
jgi:ERCC4-type nuclease